MCQNTRNETNEGIVVRGESLRFSHYTRICFRYSDNTAVEGLTVTMYGSRTLQLAYFNSIPRTSHNIQKSLEYSGKRDPSAPLRFAQDDTAVSF